MREWGVAKEGEINITNLSPLPNPHSLLPISYPSHHYNSRTHTMENDQHDSDLTPSEPRPRRQPRTPEETEAAERLARRCAELMLEKKGRDVVLMNVGELTDMADYFVLCSGDNDVHVRSLAENVREELRKEGISPWKTEGWQGQTWIIMDYVEVVVHVFYRETRGFYKLERLWSDAQIEHISDEPLKEPEE